MHCIQLDRTHSPPVAMPTKSSTLCLIKLSNPAAISPVIFHDEYSSSLAFPSSFPPGPGPALCYASVVVCHPASYARKSSSSPSRTHDHSRFRLCPTFMNLPRNFWKDGFLAELNAFRTVTAPPETSWDWEPQGRRDGAAPCACGRGRRVNAATTSPHRGSGSVQTEPAICGGEPVVLGPHPLHAN